MQVIPLELSYVLNVPRSHQTPGPASLPGHHKNHLIPMDSSLMAPLELPLATAYGVQPPHLPVLRTIWSERTQSWQSPLTFMQFVHLTSPWASFGGRSLIIIYCASIVCVSFCDGYHTFCSSISRFCTVQFFCSTISHLDLIQLSFLCSVKFISSMLVSVNFQFSSIVWLLLSILILEIYSRYFNPVPSEQHLHSKSINTIIQYKIFTWFRLSIACSEGHSPKRYEIGIYGTNFSDWGWGGRDNTLALKQDETLMWKK